MRLPLALLVAAAALVAAASSAHAQAPVAGTPFAIDGPSASVLEPAALGMSIARDGTGGLVYLKEMSGTPRVFVSRLLGGSFRRPVQVDGRLGGGSSQPVIAAGNGGLLLVAFINSGGLYVVEGNQAGRLGAPRLLASQAANPAVSITHFNKAYLAFTRADGAGHDVRTAYYENGTWALESQPLNDSPADDAGTGAGRPAVAAAGDGIAIVVWGERGQDGIEHVFSRQVWGTVASPVDGQADGALPGCTESWAGDPVVGVGGDSSYAPVAFQEQLTCGGQDQTRVLMNRFRAGQYDGIDQADGLSEASGENAQDPQIAVAEYGQGWVTSVRSDTSDAVAGRLGANGVFRGPASPINTQANSASPNPVPAIAGLYSSLVAWQQEPGSAGGGEIRIRYADGIGSLGPESVVSSPARGPTDAAGGLAAAGDFAGDGAVAWLQGSPGATQVVVAQLYQPPGSVSPARGFTYATNPQPVLSWRPASEWATYSLLVDGHLVARTSSASIVLPAPLGNGPHRWRVIASNPAGQQSAARAATVFVDTLAPRAAVRLTGHRVVGSTVRARLRYVDLAPAGKPAFDASGAARVVLRWGDGSVDRVYLGDRLAAHVYKRPGRYQITLLVSDRAGNRTRMVRFVRVVKRS